MLFISFRFILFTVFAVFGSLFVQRFFNQRSYIGFILFCNYLFYFAWNWKYGVLLFLLTLLSYFSALGSKRKWINSIGVGLILALLCFFKYHHFFIGMDGMETLNIVIPLGVSFYSLEMIGYLLDVRNGKSEAQRDFLSFAAYISFFPKIVSGPITKANDIIEQWNKGDKILLKDIETGLQIMAIGYFKKMVIADRLGVFVNDVFAAPKAFHWLTILLALLSYSIQIYMDFSGYSDIAIGCANCLGIKMHRNFDLPYASASITEFWRRWHISLSGWFKEYVYIPMGGNRKGLLRQCINLMFVMILSGMWHGAKVTFILWGVINGLFLCLEKTINKQKRDKGLINRLLTLSAIVFSWIFFRAGSIKDALEIIGCVLSFQSGIVQPYLWSFFAFGVVSFYGLYCERKTKGENIHAIYPIQNLDTVYGLTVFLIFVGLVLCLAYTEVSPFVYAAF